MSEQPDINHTESIDLEFSEDKVDQDIERTNSYQGNITKQEYDMPRVKHYKDRSQLRRHVNTSKVVHKVLPK